MSEKRIIVSVSNDVANDQRVLRVCDALSELGYNVIILGRFLKRSSSENIDHIPHKCKRFNLLFNKGTLFYANLNLRILLFLLYHKADFLLSNDLDTLPANFMISKIKRIKLFYDSHELFTEVPELTNRKTVKKIWCILERVCFKGIYKAYTVCSSIALYYKNKYGLEFAVIRNLPYYETRKKDFYSRDNIIIYQGAINKDRGIELLISSMSYIDNYRLIIAGTGDIEEKAKSMVKEAKLDDKVVFMGKLSISDLKNLTLNTKLGFSVEQNTNLNYYYALPNKIFDYINAGVPFICTDLPEIKKIVNKYNVGTIVSTSNPEDFASEILNLLNNNEKINQLHNNCLFAARELNWENEKEYLKQIFGQQ